MRYERLPTSRSPHASTFGRTDPAPRRLLQSLFAVPAVALATRPSLNAGPTFPEEHGHVARAVPKRRAEFLTARVLARRALVELGVQAAALLPRQSRAPSWPSGVVGSITHTTRLCAVAVAHEANASSIGIDAEDIAGPLDADVLRMVCVEDELRWLNNQPLESRPALGKLIFSAKEAVYKCQFPLTETYVAFEDAQLEIDLERGRFWCRTRGEARRHRTYIEGCDGRFAWTDGHVLTAACLSSAVAGQ